MFKFEYQLCLVLCLPFYVQNQNQELGLTMGWEFVRVWSRWYNQGLKDLFFTFCEVSAARSSEITGRKNISSSGWQSENALVFTWLGSYCSLRDVEKHVWQGHRALSLPSVVLPQRRDTDIPETVSTGCRCLPKSKFILLNCHHHTSCLWNQGEGRWGGSRVQTHSENHFTNLIRSKGKRDENSLHTKPDSPIRPTISHPLEPYFGKIQILGQLKPLPGASNKSALWFNQGPALAGRHNLCKWNWISTPFHTGWVQPSCFKMTSG